MARSRGPSLFPTCYPGTPIAFAICQARESDLPAYLCASFPSRPRFSADPLRPSQAPALQGSGGNRDPESTGSPTGREGGTSSTQRGPTHCPEGKALGAAVGSPDQNEIQTQLIQCKSLQHRSDFIMTQLGSQDISDSALAMQ